MDDVRQVIDRILKAVLCGDLFEPNAVQITQEFRALAKLIHPDVCHVPHCEEAFQRLNTLHRAAMINIEHGTWAASNIVYLKNGCKTIAFRFLHRLDFELGTRYVNHDAVVYVLNGEHKKFFENYLSAAKSIHYADDSMKQYFSKLMPSVKECFTATDGKHVLILSKTPEFVPLDLFLKHYGENLDARHVAWMISRMNNLCCFLFYNEMSLNGFTTQNLFVSPDFHTIAILGGWWYAVPYQSKMIGTSKDVYNLMSAVTKTYKFGSPITDIESMRGILRDIMRNTTLPKPTVEWINAGSLSNPMDELNRWDKAIEQAYGQRRFVPLHIDNQIIYQ